MPRTTRSNKEFSPWGYHITPTFVFEKKVEQIFEESRDQNPPSGPNGLFDDGLSDLSDLSSRSNSPSPPSSPPSTPSNLSFSAPTASTSQTPPHQDPPTPCSDGFLNDLDRRKARRKATRRLSRGRQREEAAASFAINKLRPAILEKYVKRTQPESCKIKLKKVKAASRGYIGPRDNTYDENQHSLESLVGPNSEGFRRLEWDGIQPMALVDANKRVIGILAGNPGDKDWDAVASEAAEALESSRRECRFAEKKKGQRSRGDFACLACGVSYGGGQKKPTNIRNTRRHQGVLKKLSKLQCFRRISGFSTSVIATRAPRLHAHYVEKIIPLYEQDPGLHRPFPSSIFCATTFNLGPCTVCYRHRDRANLAYGVCSITALGKFNHKTGGHLVLWDLCLVIDFPPGSTIIIPSAILSHSNTTIQPNENRYSFTQYTAGGLFRWVENGFMSAEKHEQMLSEEEKEMELERDRKRWLLGVELLPSLDELVSP